MGCATAYLQPDFIGEIHPGQATWQRSLCSLYPLRDRQLPEYLSYFPVPVTGLDRLRRATGLDTDGCRYKGNADNGRRRLLCPDPNGRNDLARRPGPEVRLPGVA